MAAGVTWTEISLGGPNRRVVEDETRSTDPIRRFGAGEDCRGRLFVTQESSLTRADTMENGSAGHDELYGIGGLNCAELTLVFNINNV